jgi:ABC-2 type transport system ATP-binding protein
MIEFSNLTVGYRKNRPVLKGLDGAFAKGRVHGLLGANGVGKTTLLKTLCGLLVPSSGTVAVSGKNATRRFPSTLRQLFFVPEEFDLPAVSLRRLTQLSAPLYPSFSQAAFENACNEMEIDPDKRLDAMSMGQRKKACISFALATGVEYLILDEPTNGLDIPGKSTLRRLLAAEAARGTTIIISTHQVADLEKLVDSVTIMDNNGIILTATTREIEDKFAFGPVVPGTTDEILYREESLAGPVGVTENRTGAETSVDLTLLFGAVTRNRAKVDAIMNRKNIDSHE